MLRRPKRGDREEDILDFQERFLASDEQPAVSLAGRSKRKQQPESRDVVQLGGIHQHHMVDDVIRLNILPPSGGEGVPDTKRSKFRQQKPNVVPQDPHLTTSEQVTILADIWDRDVIASPVTIPTRNTRRGFPVVHELDWKNMAPSHSHTVTHPHPHQKKKSLFAQHYDSHSPEFFGFQFKPTNQMAPIEQDKVQQLNIHPTPSPSLAEGTETTPSPLLAEGTEATPSPSLAEGTEATPTTASLAEGTEATPTTAERGEFASPASQAWTNLLSSSPSEPPSLPSLYPSLISGEGLGARGEAAAEEVRKIHAENVERLASASREELLAERKRVEQTLGGELVAFLKRRRVQGRRVGGDGEVVGVGGGEGVMRERGEGVSDTGTVAPHGWLHMGVVEKEKMEWMTDVLPEDSQQEGGPVRFSLDGLVIPRGMSLPPHHALHHHGDEPTAAGYTVKELLGLVRSAVPQQRVLSLSTLAKIMRLAWRGGYRDIVSHSVLSVLCDAGLPLLLRYAIDDKSTAVISAALTAIHSLVVPQWEELLLQEVCACHHGSSLPCMRQSWSSQRTERGKRGESDEEGDEHSEVMDRDVVQGYLVTGLLRRLRYILEVVRPGPAEVQLTLEIIVRISRHSLQAAAEVVNCPRLMDTVFREFLPLVWDPLREGDPTIPYGVPQPSAARLVQVLISASKNLSSLLLSRHRLLEVIVRYTLPHPSELSLPASHAHSLSLAALQAGKGLLQYGLATEWIRDCYPAVARQVFPLPSLSLSSLPLHEASHLAALIWLLEPAASLPPPSLPSSLTSSLITPLLSTLPFWVQEGDGGGGEEVMERLVCVRAVLNVIATYLNAHLPRIATGSTSSLPISPVQSEEAVDVVAMSSALSSPSGLLVTLATSSITSTALTGLRATSPLCQKCDPPSSPLPPSLPSLYTASLPSPPALYGETAKDDCSGFLKPYLIYVSCTDLLLGFLRLCHAASSAHKGVVSRASVLLDDHHFQEYVASVCEAPPMKYSCLTFGEFQLLYIAVKLFMLKVAGGDGVSGDGVRLYHRLALHLLVIVPPGLEYAVDNLISTVVFHPTLLPELSSLPGALLDQDLSSLSLHHPPQPLSSALPTGPAPLSSVLATTRDHVPSITSSLLASIRSSIYSQQRVDSSRHIFLSKQLPSPSSLSSSSLPSSLPSLRVPPYSSPLLPADWFMLPLVSLYQHSLSRVSGDPGSEVILTVKNCLHVQLLLEKLRVSNLAHLPPSTRLARTLITFLIGSDIFLEREVRPFLSALLAVYSSQSLQPQLDLTLPIPGLSSFHDLYQSLLLQYSAVSYGDPLFSSYVLLPLQQRFPVSLRRTIWDQHSHTLRLLSLPLDQLPVALDCFLLPPETDHELLNLYVGALATGCVQPQWSPVLYLIAVHHVHHFLFSGAAEDPINTQYRDKLESVLQHMKRKDTQAHILHYAGPTSDTGLGFKMNA